MPEVTDYVRAWDFGPVPATERLQVIFVPSGSAFTKGTLFPLREERVEPAGDGLITTNLAQTTAILGDAFYRIRFEWFETHPVMGWRKKGSSEIDGELRVPAAGGKITDLLQFKAPPGRIMHGFGAPPSFLRGVLYIDRSGAKPKLYAPKGALI